MVISDLEHSPAWQNETTNDYVCLLSVIMHNCQTTGTKLHHTMMTTTTTTTVIEMYKHLKINVQCNDQKHSLKMQTMPLYHQVTLSNTWTTSTALTSNTLYTDMMKWRQQTILKQQHSIFMTFWGQVSATMANTPICQKIYLSSITMINIINYVTKL